MLSLLLHFNSKTKCRVSLNQYQRNQQAGSGAGDGRALPDLAPGAAGENQQRQARQGEVSKRTAKPHFSCSQYKAKIVRISMAHLPQVLNFLIQRPRSLEAPQDEQPRAEVTPGLPRRRGNLQLMKSPGLWHRLIVRRQPASSRGAQQRGQ